jgi:SAM-dependent methyltransferase
VRPPKGNGRPPLLWLRFAHEIDACPACASEHVTLLEPFKIQRDASGRRVTFLTGCHSCGLLFTNPLPSREELDRQYAPGGSWRAGRAARASKPQPQPAGEPDPRDLLLDALAAYVPVRHPAGRRSVLDFGCGDGQFLDRLQAAGWDTFGIEPSTDAPFARHTRLEQVPADPRFDFAILHHVLEHVTEPLTILQALAAAVREDGMLFIGIPRLDTLPRHLDFKYCIDGRRHLVSLSETCLRGLLARAGFAVVARLDEESLDRALTKGKPLRLRLVARRTSQPQPMVADPLRAARAALSGYRRQVPGYGGRLGDLMPVRMRGAFLDKAIERRARRRRREREASPVKQLD